jgi:hypothetical protein
MLNDSAGAVASDVVSVIDTLSIKNPPEWRARGLDFLDCSDAVASGDSLDRLAAAIFAGRSVNEQRAYCGGRATRDVFGNVTHVFGHQPIEIPMQLDNASLEASQLCLH